MKVINMNTAQIEKLINLVNKYPQLYDASNIEHSDQHMRDQIWETIGKELNLTGELCRAKWTILRSGYRKALRNSQAYNRKKWRFADNMNFLKDCIQSKRSLRTLETKKNEAISEEDDDLLEIKAEPEETKLEDYVQEEDSDCVSIAEVVKMTQRDGVTQFFMSMAESVKALPPLVQAQVKAEVFRCVNAAEIKYLQEKN